MRQLVTSLAAAAVLMAATGGSGADASASAITTSIAATAATAASTTPSPPDAFPITITHKYGETTIDAEPLRVVSVGYTDHDFLLALGVTPVGVRDWYGDQPFATWPWAQDALGDAEPALIGSTELNYEQIAALEPDVIVGVSSGMTDEEYATLSKIAPTVVQPGDFVDYGTPWDVATELIGDALGRGDEAAAVVHDVRQSFAEARTAHPEFDGATGAVAFLYETDPGAYASSDSRSRVLTDLGFAIPSEFDELAGDSFFFTVSQEDLAPLDTDVVVWIVAADIDSIASMPLRPSMRAFEEGREIVTDELLSAALSFSSPLSLPFVLEQLVPELALAVDGDPATVVPSAELLGGPSAGAAELDADEQAAADAWSVVFDSNATFADKAANLEDAEALRPTIESYTAAGSAMGGISLEPTAVTIDGETATVAYDVLFGGTAAYTDQTGTLDMIDGVWVVPRSEFCSFMASARNPCPAQ